jgi:outer membrane biosynthesis protein TonB
MSEFVPRHPLLKILIGLLVVAVAGLIVWSLQGLFSGPPAKAKVPPKIVLVPDRSPPPPPKPEEKRPEPPKTEQKEVKLDQPKSAPQPPSESLKMEGAAGSGQSAFQQGSVSNEDLSRAGNGDFGGNAFNAYAQTVKRRIEQSLARVNGLRGFPYKVEVRIWVSGSGTISRSELVDSTGNPEADALLRTSLRELPTLGEAPPAGMPQPVRLRLTSS